MKRAGKIFEEFVSKENLQAAFKEADQAKDEEKYPELTEYKKDVEGNLNRLRNELIAETWQASTLYRSFTTWDTGKERRVDWNPKIDDAIVQHAVQQTAGQVLLRAAIRDTYSGIIGRGEHDGVKRVARFIRRFDLNLTPIYILKMDVRKFYASVDLEILKQKIRRKIKDERMLRVIDSIIDSHPNGLPIGNYLSQHFANFFLAEYDHAVKARGIKFYARYCDDIVAISSDKNELKALMEFSIDYMKKIHLEIKPNAQVYPIERNGLDFLGYVFHRHSIRLRKRNERSFRKACRCFKENRCEETLHPIESYHGLIKWTSHGERLWNKLLNQPLKQLQRKVRKNAETDSRKSEN